MTVKIVQNTVDGCFWAATAKASAAYIRTFNGTQRLDIVLSRLLTLFTVTQQFTAAAESVYETVDTIALLIFPSSSSLLAARYQLNEWMKQRRYWRSPSPFCMVSHKPLHHGLWAFYTIQPGYGLQLPGHVQDHDLPNNESSVNKWNNDSLVLEVFQDSVWVEHSGIKHVTNVRSWCGSLGSHRHTSASSSSNHFHCLIYLNM